MRGAGVDHAKLGVLGVEAEHEVRVAPLDAEAQGLEVQPFANLPLRHFVCLVPASSGRLCSTDESLLRGERENYKTCLGRLFLLSKRSQTNGRRYGNFTTDVSRNGLVPR